MPSSVAPTARVMVVDDDAQMRLLLAAVLRRAGHELVAEADDGGTAAVRLAVAHAPDIVVLDMMMPNPGLTTLPQIRAASPATRVVMYSATATAAAWRQALELGASAVVDKLQPPSALLQAIAEVLSAR